MHTEVCVICVVCCGSLLKHGFFFIMNDSHYKYTVVNTYLFVHSHSVKRHDFTSPNVSEY